VAAYFRDLDATRVQISCALFAVAGALLVCWLATVASLARGRQSGTVALGCGLGFVTLFLVDIATLAVSALRPSAMAHAPELAVALRDMELLLMGVAAPLVTAMLVACASLALREGAVWPRWVGRLATLAAAVYVLRLGTLFTVDGAFAADGVLGLYVPVAALAGWIVVASLALFGPRRAL
jgi:hypothetical protein